MAHDLILTPHLDDQRAAQLTPLVEYLDWQLDHPTGTPQPVAHLGLLAQLGTFLWEATRLEFDAVRTALDVARESERPLRFVVQGEHWQHLPWELLYHVHPDLGFVARHPWCVVSRRLRGTGERQPRLMPRPLRLLLFIASPEDLDPERSRLDFEREEELLFTAMDRPLARGEVDPETRLLGFRAPFVLDTLYEPLRREAFDGMEEHSLLAAIQKV
jgi:hypothetical protein